MVARKPAPRRTASLEPPSSRLSGRVRLRTMPATAPIRMETKEARNATVELMGVGHLVGAGGIKEWRWRVEAYQGSGGCKAAPHPTFFRSTTSHYVPTAK